MLQGSQEAEIKKQEDLAFSCAQGQEDKFSDLKDIENSELSKTHRIILCLIDKSRKKRCKKDADMI